MLIWLSGLAAFGACAGTSVQAADSWPVGGFAPISSAPNGVQMIRGMWLAERDVNNARPGGALAPGCNVTVIPADTRSDIRQAARLAFRLTSQPRKIGVMVGAWRSDVTQSLTLIGNVMNSPTLSYSATSTALTQEGTFARTVGSDAIQAASILAFMCGLSPPWREAVVIAASSPYALSFVNEFATQATAAGISVNVEQHAPLETSRSAEEHIASINRALDRIEARNVRVVVMNNAPDDARLVLSEARRRNMTGLDQGGRTAPYVWLGTDYWGSPELFLAGLNATRLMDEGCDASCVSRARMALQGILSTEQSAGAVRQWRLPWMASVWDPAVGPGQLTPEQKMASGLDSWRGKDMAPKAPYAYDAVLLAVEAMRRACQGRGNVSATGCEVCRGVFSDGAAVYASMLRGLELSDSPVPLATGPIRLDAKGDRRVVIDIKQMLPAAASGFGVAALSVASYTPSTTAPLCQRIAVNTSLLRWPDGRTAPPSNVGPCPPGQVTAIGALGSSFCSQCSGGRYNLDSTSSCHECPEPGAECPGGADVELKTGFWATPVRDGKVAVFGCRPLPDVCCPASGCAAGLGAITPEWGSSLCAPDRKGPLCGECRSGLSFWSGKCVNCQGVNWGVILGNVLFALAGLVLVLRLVPSNDPTNRLTIDYVQLVGVVLVSVPGGRLQSLSALLDSGLFNLDISVLFTIGEDASSGNGWPANGSFPSAEPPLPPPSASCAMPVSPLGSTLVPLAYPLTLFCVILFTGCCWRGLADRVLPSSRRTAFITCLPCLLTPAPWMREDAKPVITQRGGSPGAPKNHPTSRSGRVGRARGAPPPAPASQGAGALDAPRDLLPQPATALASAAASSAASPLRRPLATTTMATMPADTKAGPFARSARPSAAALAGTGTEPPADTPSVVPNPLMSRAPGPRDGFRPDGMDSSDSDGPEPAARGTGRAEVTAVVLAPPSTSRGTPAAASTDGPGDGASSLAILRRELRKETAASGAAGVLDTHSALSPAMREARALAGASALPRLEVRSGHMLANDAAVEAISGAWCWWFRLPASGACLSGRGPWFAGQSMLWRLGPSASRAARRVARQRHWAHVSSASVIRAVLRWATLSANAVTGVAWTLLACREVDGELLLELQPAVRCWTSQHIAAVVVMTVFLLFLAVGLPAVLVCGYDRMDKRAGAWQAQNRERVRRIMEENAARGAGVVARFIGPLAAIDGDGSDSQDDEPASRATSCAGNGADSAQHQPGRRRPMLEPAEGADLSSDDEDFLSREHRMQGPHVGIGSDRGSERLSGTPLVADLGTAGAQQAGVGTQGDTGDTGIPSVRAHTAVRIAGAEARSLGPYQQVLAAEAHRIGQSHAAPIRIERARSRRRQSLGTVLKQLPVTPDAPPAVSVVAQLKHASKLGSRAGKGAFVEMASAEDAAFTWSLGVPLLEVMQAYRPGVRGMFEAFVFVRRVVMTAAVVFLAATPSWRQIALLALAVAFLVVHLLVLPYAAMFANAYAGGLLVFLCFICGLETFNTPQYLMDPEHGTSGVASAIATIEAVLVLGPVAFVVLRTVWRVLSGALLPRLRKRASPAGGAPPSLGRTSAKGTDGGESVVRDTQSRA